MGLDEQNDDGLGGRFRDRQAFTAANRWAEPLAALDEVQLAAAALPEHVHEEVVLARRLGADENWLARDRSLHRIDKLVRELEPEEIARIDAFLARPDRANRALGKRVAAWRKRLTDEGEPAVRAFAQEFEGVDQQRLRQVVRQIRKGDAGDRARRILEEILAVVR
jgi:ribosomal 50S subunit-associated protein YjgA (DUF615 family)